MLVGHVEQAVGVALPASFGIGTDHAHIGQARLGSKFAPVIQGLHKQHSGVEKQHRQRAVQLRHLMEQHDRPGIEARGRGHRTGLRVVQGLQQNGAGGAAADLRVQLVHLGAEGVKMSVMRHSCWPPDTKRLLKVPLPGADRFRRRPLSAPWAARDRLGQAVRSPARSGARILDLVSGRACKRVLDDAADRALRGLDRVHPHGDPRGLRFAARRLRPARATGARYTNARDTAAGSCFVARRRWNNVLSGSDRGGRNGTRFR